MRLLILFHRYLGIAIGVVMAMWCVSGFVMMYEGFPNLDNDQRLRALEPLSWNACCAFDKLGNQLGVDVIEGFNVEMLGGRPALRTTMTQGRRQIFDLITGERLDLINEAQAVDVAGRFAAALNVQAVPEHRGTIDIDQWTVQMGRDRPIHRVALNDEAETEVYVSGKTGQVIQHTNYRQRFWNYLGAVPHWLYPTVLRQNGPLWNRVVVYLSLAGVFLTIMGLYIGIAHWLAAPGSRWSTYRGLNLWHHLSGLFFGVLTLTWVGSGLVSMNPWGLLEGSSAANERERARDMWIDGNGTIATIKNMVDKNLMGTRFVSAPIDGHLHLVTHKVLESARIDAKTLAAKPLERDEVERITKRIVEDEKFELEFLTEGDDYYYSGHDPVDLPVYRITVDNADRTRYYLSPLTGEVLGKIDTQRRWYRWLFEGLHRLDFAAMWRQRPLWDLIVLPLLLGVTVVCSTGVWMGYKRLTK